MSCPSGAQLTSLQLVSRTQILGTRIEVHRDKRLLVCETSATWSTAKLRMTHCRSSYPRPGTNTQATRKFSIPQPSAALDGSTHDMKAVNDQGLRLYVHNLEHTDDSRSAETPVSAIHSATSNNGDTSHTSHDKDPNLERASLGRMWDEGRAFPKKPLHKATQELVPGLKQYNPPSTSVS